MMPSPARRSASSMVSQAKLGGMGMLILCMIFFQHNVLWGSIADNSRKIADILFIIVHPKLNNTWSNNETKPFSEKKHPVWNIYYLQMLEQSQISITESRRAWGDDRKNSKSSGAASWITSDWGRPIFWIFFARRSRVIRDSAESRELFNSKLSPELIAAKKEN